LIRAASATSAARSATSERSYLCHVVFERLAQDLEDLAAELGPFIQEQHAVVRQRHLAGHRDVAAAD
jgi:hypothetical protein